MLQFSFEDDLKRWQENRKRHQTEGQKRRLPDESEIRGRRTALFYVAGKIERNAHVNPKLAQKLRLFNMVITPTLTYASGT